MPQTIKETMEVIQLTPQNQIPERIVEETDVLVPHEEEEIIEVLQKQVQCIDEIIDLPVAMQRQVLASQTAQKSVEVPQVQFLDRAVGVPVATQTERIQECIDEETVVPGPRVMEEILEAVKLIPPEHVQNHTGEQSRRNCQVER